MCFFNCATVHSEEVDSSNVNSPEIELNNIDPTVIQNTINSFKDEISELEATHGAYHVSIGENLISLGVLYQSQGEYRETLKVLERTLEIYRVNYGLHSEEQFTIVEQLITTHTNLQNWVAVNKYQEYLYWLNRRVHGENSIKLIPGLSGLIQWKIKALKERLLDDDELLITETRTLIRKAEKIAEPHPEINLSIDRSKIPTNYPRSRRQSRSYYY